MPKAKRELDAYTLRAIADELAEARDVYADAARRYSIAVYDTKAGVLRGVARRLRTRATRIERTQKRRGRA